MDKQKITAYLDRIGLTLDLDSFTPDYELLCKLQYAHVTHVPYENLDLIHHIPLTLTPEAIYDKVVIRHRGGYCFELNCLFNWLLEQLGYRTVNYMARYIRGETGTPIRRHRIIVAESDYTDGKIMCDVGIGDRAPRYPLKLEVGTLQEQFGETYRLEKDDFYGWLISDFHKDEWVRFFGFTEEVQLDIDYVQPSFYCEAHPNSIFHKSNIVSIKTDTGRKTIAGMLHRVFDGDSVTEVEIKDDAELNSILRDVFGIVM